MHLLVSVKKPFQNKTKNIFTLRRYVFCQALCAKFILDFNDALQSLNSAAFLQKYVRVFIFFYLMGVYIVLTPVARFITNNVIIYNI
jgi:hypothetical protein